MSAAGGCARRADVEGEGEHFSPLDRRRPPIEAADVGRSAFSASRSSRTRWQCRSRRRGRARSDASTAGVIAMILVVGVVRFRLSPASAVRPHSPGALDDRGERRLFPRRSSAHGVDGGDDGLFYDGNGRQNFFAGNFYEATRGESVYLYSRNAIALPRARARRVRRRLSRLSLIASLLPFFMLALFRRFLPGARALVLIILFVAVPIGVLFGSVCVQVPEMGGARHIRRMLLLGRYARRYRREDDWHEPLSASCLAVLLAFAVVLRPVVAAATVLAAGVGLTLYRRDGRSCGALRRLHAAAQLVFRRQSGDVYQGH